ncbi:C39 family peptidase [Nonomuraea sp. NPDC050328]|uniref:C39 family peptidase n=1 Tax=Nonomuraea sp. NPDC050328 TaxID=3364361 RepID=UPI0037AE05A6
MFPVALHRHDLAGPAERGSAAYADPFGDGSALWPYERRTGPVREIGFPATELVVTWIARTPPGSWLEVELQVCAERWSRWYVMGRWAEHDGDIHRTSVPGQGDADGDVAVDTFVAAVPVTAYRLRVTTHGSGAHVERVTVLASAVPPRAGVPVSEPGPARGVVLDLPAYSQKAHTGHHPQWDGGGQNWCSPASVAMVMAYWKHGPGPEELAWVGEDDPCPLVDHAAAGMYDHSYQGTGNWPFSVAYAGRYGLTGFVTRLASLAELEHFIAAGIPVITSQSFKEHELPGAGYSTGGHIMVVAGFTPDGDVVAHDPAAPADSGVRRVYPRAAFENVWLRSSGSGGIVYILHPPGVPLPHGW